MYEAALENGSLITNSQHFLYFSVQNRHCHLYSYWRHHLVNHYHLFESDLVCSENDFQRLGKKNTHFAKEAIAVYGVLNGKF